jgi:biotin carboxylase
MQRILLLMATTTYKAQAFLAAAEHLGVHVTVGSDRRQALADLHPEGNLSLDFTSPRHAAREIVAFARRHPLDAIVAADDDGVLLAAHAAAALGLPYNAVNGVRAARDKRWTRTALRSAGLPVPAFRAATLDDDPARLAALVEYPCVLKPVALAASRGVMRADDRESFVTAFRRLGAILDSRDVRRASGDLAHEILVESFIPGTEVALEGLLDHGRLRVLALFDKPDPLDGPFFEETIYVTPSRHAPAAQEALAGMTARCCTALGLTHGPLHAELRWNDQGAWLLEAAPRSIGGLCARSLRFGPQGDVSLEELLLRHALGQPTEELAREARPAGVMMIPIPAAGVLREVRGREAAAAVAGIDDVVLTIPPGQEVAPPPEGGRYLGFLFAHGETPAAVEASLRTAHAQLGIEIEGPRRSPVEDPPPVRTRGEVDAQVHG